MSARARRILRHDRHVVLAVALVLPVVLVQFLGPGHDPAPAIILAGLFLLFQLAVATRSASSVVHELVRLGAALVFVTLVARMGSEAGIPSLLILYTPIVVLAAAIGRKEALVIGGLAMLGYVAPVVLDPTHDPFLRERAVILTVMTAALSIGTRQVVRSLELATERRRRVLQSDRERSRRIAAIEEVGRLLAEDGPTQDSLTRVMDLLTDRIGFGHASLYFGDERMLRLGAQRGYVDPIAAFVPEAGVLGRVMRTRTAALVVNVADDPDYIPARDVVQSLVSVPLLASGELIGAINVESSPPHRLDSDDLATVRLVGDRVASALALARERERLAARATRFERLTVLTHQLTTTLDIAELEGVIARGVTTVVPAQTVALSIRDIATGTARERAWDDGKMAGPIGADISVLVADVLSNRSPRFVGPGPAWPDGIAAAVPLIRGEEGIGALALIRTGPDPFNDLEREVLPLIASQIALAVSNAELHRAVTEASIHDPLTGLYNRRYLDVALANLSAARARKVPVERGMISVVLFDLDHFGKVNKRHGHAVGDEVLRRFGQILDERARAGDLVARFGGEEFVAVLDGADRAGARAFAEDVRQQLERTDIRSPGGERLHVTVSAGVSTASSEIAAIEPTFRIADAGLALAKHAGRNAVVEA